MGDNEFMTSSLLTPRCQHHGALGRSPDEVGGETRATAILDTASGPVEALIAEHTDAPTQREFLRAVHADIASTVRAVYAMEDLQPASFTLRRGRGSCSQRLAVLEAAARGKGISTRVRGIAVDGSFWYPRFPKLKTLVPDRVILAWPEFRIDGTWVPVSELYGTLGEMAACGVGFTNAGGETLFDAIGRTAVDWDGTTGGRCDLSAAVSECLGYFDSRDELFLTQGQTLAWLPRKLADGVMSRRSAAGAR